MKKHIVLLLLLCLSRLAIAQQIKFPESFEAGSKLFPQLKPAVITEEIIKETGLTKNKGVSNDYIIKATFLEFKFQEEDVERIYYEVYQGIANEHDDAGFSVAEFTNEKVLLTYLPNLRYQSNEAYVKVGKYLISIWSDESSRQQATLQRVSNYFIQKLGGTLLINPKPQNGLDKGVEVAEAAATAVEAYGVMEDEEETAAAKERRAYSLMNEEKFEEAIALYYEVLKLEPENDRAYFNITWMYATSEQHAKTLAVAKEALKHVPTDRYADFNRVIANAYNEMDSFFEARKYYELSLKQDPNSTLTLYNYGFNRFKAHDYQKSIDLLQLALNKGFDDESYLADIDFYIGTSYSELKKYELALQYLNKALAKSNFESYYFNKAEVYSRMHDNNKAEQVCTEGIKENPQSGILYFKRYQMRKGLGKIEEANKDLDDAYRLTPDNPQILMDMGVKLSDENRDEEALELYRKAMPTSTEKGGIYSNMGSIFAKNELTRDSSFFYHRKALVENPKAFGYYLNYANTYKDIEQYAEAEKYYKIAYELNPEHDAVLGNYAIALLMQDKNQEAQKLLLKGVDLFPEDFELNILLAKNYLENIKDYVAAEKYASIALKHIKPGKSKLNVLSVRANARMMQGSYKNAIADFLEITNLLTKDNRPHNFEIYSNIGYCYLYSKEYNNASAYFEQSLSYQEDIDAVLGLLFVAYATQNDKNVQTYKSKALKLFPKLKEIKSGLTALEKEGYNYTTELKNIMNIVFAK